MIKNIFLNGLMCSTLLISLTACEVETELPDKDEIQEEVEDRLDTPEEDSQSENDSDVPNEETDGQQEGGNDSSEPNDDDNTEQDDTQTGSEGEDSDTPEDNQQPEAPQEPPVEENAGSMVECETYTGPQLNEAPIAQQYVNAEPFPAGTFSGRGNGVDGDTLYYLGQQTPNGKLALGPNEHFHDYKNGITLGGLGLSDLPNSDLNKEETYAYIDNWSDINNTLIWGVWLEETGTANLSLNLGIDDADAGAKVAITLGQQTAICTTISTAGKNNSQTLWEIPFTVNEPGYHQLEIQAQSLTGNEVGRLYSMELGGPALEDAQVLRARWRPAAVHAQFQTSLNQKPKRMWVLEITPSEFDNWFYAPATTQFGYFGSGRQIGGVVAGVNFSMWSFGKNEEEPVIEQLSHLIAAGHPLAELDGFSHEGTGVKVREWNPYDGHIPAKQILALRMEPGNPYDTYYGYFLDPATNQWQLFGAGKRFNDGFPNESVTVGSFIEVVGGSDNTRTGSKQREVKYRGWYQDVDGQWAAMDSLNFNDIAGDYVNKAWAVQDDEMIMRMGGFAHHLGQNGNQVALTPERAPLPSYLQGDYLQQLQAMPASLSVMSANRITTNSARARFDISELGSNAKVTLYWGEQESLTFADLWQNSVDISQHVIGTNEVALSNLSADKEYFYRVYIENDQGKVWSLNTSSFKTLKN